MKTDHLFDERLSRYFCIVGILFVLNAIRMQNTLVADQWGSSEISTNDDNWSNKNYKIDVEKENGKMMG
eukprot:CAMPEP_0195293518 /NCGR_PEP_ID=MMETSP0707-20130614/12648_1 /TAXON_ID=33640 /ORGANISM="Asterionellopsis glacialis, Strain CCMP134" /LENGTH=68 /DNA_ID=CAMNT_0040354253 /DNA_START=66 /DNA_END=269 /DNA_ORIENTATION=+